VADVNDSERDQAVAVALLRVARCIGLDPTSALDWAETGGHGDDDPLFVAAREIAKADIFEAAGEDPQHLGRINADVMLAGAWRALLALAVEGAIGTDRQPAEVIEQAMQRITWPELSKPSPQPFDRQLDTREIDTRDPVWAQRDSNP
jgi:hypothetical protein